MEHYGVRSVSIMGLDHILGRSKPRKAKKKEQDDEDGSDLRLQGPERDGHGAHGRWRRSSHERSPPQPAPAAALPDGMSEAEMYLSPTVGRLLGWSREEEDAAKKALDARRRLLEPQVTAHVQCAKWRVLAQGPSQGSNGELSAAPRSRSEPAQLNDTTLRPTGVEQLEGPRSPAGHAAQEHCNPGGKGHDCAGEGPGGAASKRQEPLPAAESGRRGCRVVPAPLSLPFSNRSSSELKAALGSVPSLSYLVEGASPDVVVEGNNGGGGANGGSGGSGTPVQQQKWASEGASWWEPGSMGRRKPSPLGGCRKGKDNREGGDEWREAHPLPTPPPGGPPPSGRANGSQNLGLTLAGPKTSLAKAPATLQVASLKGRPQGQVASPRGTGEGLLSSSPLKVTALKQRPQPLPRPPESKSPPSSSPPGSLPKQHATGGSAAAQQRPGGGPGGIGLWPADRGRNSPKQQQQQQQGAQPDGVASSPKQLTGGAASSSPRQAHSPLKLQPQPSPSRSSPSHSPTGGSRRLAPQNWTKGQEIGRGSFGTVFEGLNLDDGSFFAVKEIQLRDSAPVAEEIEQEVGVLSRLSHPNIVQYLGTSKEEEKLYVFLELVTKGSLASILSKYHRLDERLIRTYARQILQGLEYLHNMHTMHRDIKCANVLVDASGQVKLSDFGMAKQVDKLSPVTSMKGSPYWMAPEVLGASGAGGYGLPADIWSLGCTVLEMAEGRPPWSNLEGYSFLFRLKNRELPDIPAHLSPEARSFVLACLNHDAANRPTAIELLRHPFVAAAAAGWPGGVSAPASPAVSEHKAPALAHALPGNSHVGVHGPPYGTLGAWHKLGPMSPGSPLPLPPDPTLSPSLPQASPPQQRQLAPQGSVAGPPQHLVWAPSAPAHSSPRPGAVSGSPRGGAMAHDAGSAASAAAPAPWEEQRAAVKGWPLPDPGTLARGRSETDRGAAGAASAALGAAGVPRDGGAPSPAKPEASLQAGGGRAAGAPAAPPSGHGAGEARGLPGRGYSRAHQHRGSSGDLVAGTSQAAAGSQGPRPWLRSEGGVPWTGGAAWTRDKYSRRNRSEVEAWIELQGPGPAASGLVQGSPTAAAAPAAVSTGGSPWREWLGHRPGSGGGGGGPRLNRSLSRSFSDPSSLGSSQEEELLRAVKELGPRPMR